MRYFNFTAIELVHVGTPLAAIISVAKSRIEYTDDDGQNLNVDLEECARIYGCLRQLGAFPPDEGTNWGELIDSVPDFATLPMTNVANSARHSSPKLARASLHGCIAIEAICCRIAGRGACSLE
jgi:hypothetical protein